MAITTLPPIVREKPRIYRSFVRIRNAREHVGSQRELPAERGVLVFRVPGKDQVIDREMSVPLL